VSATWPSSFPELVTKRLRLRAPLLADAAALFVVLGDPEVTRYHNMPTLMTQAEARAALDRLAERYAARDTIRWAIELVEPGESAMIGTVGLLRFDFEHRRAEIGYEIARRWWNQGVATEAAAAVIGYGFGVLGLHRIEAGVMHGNDASVRVLEKLGFLEEGTRRDYAYFKGGFHSFRSFSLLETEQR
jgi:[ribosomal protein S5]-alanine N-acetyltransferase